MGSRTKFFHQHCLMRLHPSCVRSVIEIVPRSSALESRSSWLLFWPSGIRQPASLWLLLPLRTTLFAFPVRQAKWIESARVLEKRTWRPRRYGAAGVLTHETHKKGKCASRGHHGASILQPQSRWAQPRGPSAGFAQEFTGLSGFEREKARIRPEFDCLPPTPRGPDRLPPQAALPPPA